MQWLPKSYWIVLFQPFLQHPEKFFSLWQFHQETAYINSIAPSITKRRLYGWYSRHCKHYGYFLVSLLSFQSKQWIKFCIGIFFSSGITTNVDLRIQVSTFTLLFYREAFIAQGAFIILSIVMWITEFLATYITAFISHTGYITVFLGMTMESMILPVPSEAIIPFAGFLVATKQFSLRGVILVSTCWSIVGSLVSYYIGFYWWKAFIRRFGKYFLLDQEELDQTKHFFRKRWSITILVSRFIPVVRHLISLPAGMWKMNLTKFLIYTIIGAVIRNTFLTLVGKYLKENRELVMKYSHTVDIVVLAILIGLVLWFVYRQIRKYRRKKFKISKS